MANNPFVYGSDYGSAIKSGLTWKNTPTSVSTNNDGAQLGGKYQSLVDANPYRNQTYQKSPWQNLLSSLGFRTQADAWQENMSVQAAEYDAAIAQKQYDEQYNDPLAQVERMRNAGLNPDIDGGSSINSGSAAPLGEDPSTPMQTTGEEDLPLQFANHVLSGFSSALGMLGTFQGMHRTHLQNVMQSLQNEQVANQLFGSLSPMMLPESQHPDGIENFDWKAAAMNNTRAFAKTMPKKLQKSFIDYQERFFKSAIGEGESYEAFKKRISSGRSAAIESQTFWSELPSVLLQITEPLADASEKIYSSGQERELAENGAATAEAQNAETYANAFGEKGGSTQQAELDIAEIDAGKAAAKRAKTNDEMVSILNGTIDNIIKNLQRTAEDGGLKGGLASLALVMMAGVRLWLVSQGAPNISRSESQSHSLRQGDYGRSDSGSRGFSISW